MNSTGTMYSDDSVFDVENDNNYITMLTKEEHEPISDCEVTLDSSKFVTWAARLEFGFLNLQQHIDSTLDSLATTTKSSTQANNFRQKNVIDSVSKSQVGELKNKLDYLTKTSARNDKRISDMNCRIKKLLDVISSQPKHIPDDDFLDTFHEQIAQGFTDLKQEIRSLHHCLETKRPVVQTHTPEHSVTDISSNNFTVKQICTGGSLNTSIITQNETQNTGKTTDKPGKKRRIV